MAKKNPNPLDDAHSKAMRKKNRDKGGGAGKYGRNKTKCAKYRARKGSFGVKSRSRRWQ